VRDAASFIVAGAERGLSGVFNLTGSPMTWEQFLGACQTISNSDCELRWIADDDILAAGVVPWAELPLWIPARHKPLRHFLEISTARAFEAGLQTRASEETVRDILTWDRQRRAMALKAGLPTDKESALLSQ
jgi:2'-hydroxyisoflavone reductase